MSIRHLLVVRLLPALFFILVLHVDARPIAAQAAVNAAARRLDSASMLTHAKVLSHDSLEGRRAGTTGGVKARNYVAAEMASIGLRPFGGSLVREFTMTPGRDTVQVQPANVVGMIAGKATPGRYIVISAHFDHLGIRNGEVFNGADDNASGTGALLALAKYFRANVPNSSIIFLAADAEERGLQGARAFVATPPVPADSIVMNVNLDMVGRNDKGELYATGTMHYPYLKPFIELVQPRAAVTLLMGHDQAPPGGPSSDNWTNASDHGAFHAQKIPFLYFGVEDHPDYHRATDEFQGIQPGFYVRAIETVLDVLLRVDANSDVILRRGRPE